MAGIVFLPGDPPITPPSGIIPCPTCAAHHAAVDAASEKAWDEGCEIGCTGESHCYNNPYRKGGTT